MARLINHDKDEVRVPESLDDYKERLGGDSIKFKNKHGDVMVFTPAEAKDVLTQYIHDELELFSDEVVKRNKGVITEKLEFRIKQLEKDIIEHLDDKFLKLTERIVEATIERRVNEEVEKRLKK